MEKDHVGKKSNEQAITVAHFWQLENWYRITWWQMKIVNTGKGLPQTPQIVL